MGLMFWNVNEFYVGTSSAKQNASLYNKICVNEASCETLHKLVVGEGGGRGGTLVALNLFIV